MYRKLLILTALAAAAPAVSQTLLGQLLSKAVKPRAATPGQPGSSTAAMTPDQQAALDRLLAQPLPDRRVAADRQEADQVIRAVVATGACATGPSAWNAVTRPALISLSKRVLAGDEITTDQLYAVAPDPVALDQLERVAWQRLSQW